MVAPGEREKRKREISGSHYNCYFSLHLHCGVHGDFRPAGYIQAKRSGEYRHAQIDVPGGGRGFLLSFRNPIPPGGNKRNKATRPKPQWGAGGNCATYDTAYGIFTQSLHSHHGEEDG